MTTTIYVPNNPPVKGEAYTFPVVLYSQADTKIIKTSPTLAAGDVLVGYEGQEPTSNIASLPTSTTSGRLEVACSTAETNHNQVTIKFHDAAGAEWCDLVVTFQTYTAAAVAAVDPTTPPTAGAIADAVWDEALSGHTTAGTAGKALGSATTLGPGSSSWVITVRVDGLARDGVDVWISSDLAGATIIARGTTDDNGQVTFMLDAGTYYCWKQLAGVSFTNPETFTVT